MSSNLPPMSPVFPNTNLTFWCDNTFIYLVVHLFTPNAKNFTHGTNPPRPSTKDAHTKHAVQCSALLFSEVHC